jgi:hypothetical protein
VAIVAFVVGVLSCTLVAMLIVAVTVHHGDNKVRPGPIDYEELGIDPIAARDDCGGSQVRLQLTHYSMFKLKLRILNI